MRKETKVLKELLKAKFPNAQFHIRYKETTNYIDTSDKIVITCDNSVSIDDVVCYLKENTSKMAVYKNNEYASIGGDYESKIKSVTGEWIDADMVEFIQVKEQ